ALDLGKREAAFEHRLCWYDDKHTSWRSSPFGLFRATLPQFRRLPFSLHSGRGTQCNRKGYPRLVIQARDGL
ncbi:MAG: hypothetical protein ACRCTX_16555, partial [Afipia sp.]